MGKRVAILGGGVAGMSAAHELCTRGFEVDVYERNVLPGGKARSFDAPGTGKAAMMDLPAEHGFRFFPGFYQHLPDTMKRIPLGDGGSVHDNLVEAERLQIARCDGQSEFFAPAGFPQGLSQLKQALGFLWTYATKLGIQEDDLMGRFVPRVVRLISSCDERLKKELEPRSWWEYSGAMDANSEPYEKYLGDGLTRTMVAAKAREISACTAGSIVLQIAYQMSLPKKHLDFVLNAPTNEAWIRPWRAFLETGNDKKTAVHFHMRTGVTAIHCSHGEITGVTVDDSKSTFEVTADYYIAALPLGPMRCLVNDEMKAAEPRLAGLDMVEERWMNGVQFYLGEKATIVNGHTVYIDSPWALTSVSQGQFWKKGGLDHRRLRDGEVRDILSVDVSEWERDGLGGQHAKNCSAEQIKAEVWEQIKLHLNDDDQSELGNDNYVDAVLDPAITFSEQGVRNSEPLLINKAGTWDHRPEATTHIKRLFLASDYVQTHTDLATMEAANEAARAAVNGILDAEESDQKRCMVKAFQHPFFVDAWRAADRFAFKHGLPNPVERLGLLQIDLATVMTLDSQLALYEWQLNQDALRAQQQVTLGV